jgi:hypothetical protein
VAVKDGRSIKAILPHAIAFLEAANAERATGLPLEQLAHQAGIQEALAKPGLILGNIERHSRYRRQLARLCQPAVAARLQLVAGLVQRVTYQRGVPTLLIPLGYSPVVMALPLVFSHAGIPLGRARSPHFSDGDFGRLCKTVGHLARGKLFMASEQQRMAGMPAEMFGAAPVPKEQDSPSVVFDGLCRLVFYLNWQADKADMTDPTLMLN